jgi:hypothetical protein
MINRNISRRLERLEDLRTLSGIHHVITVTCVGADGSQTGGGYRIEGPSTGGEWRRIPLSVPQEDVRDG